MLEDHKNDEQKTALVVCNSFDADRFDIEDFLQDRQYMTEMFEVDRMPKEERLDYLNCFREVKLSSDYDFQMYQTTEFPMVFVKDQFIGGYVMLKLTFIEWQI